MNKQENPPVVAVPGSIHVEAATLTCARFVALWLAGRGLDPAKALRAVLGLVPELRHAAGAGGFLAVALRRDGLEAFSSDSRAAVDRWMNRAAKAGDHALGMSPATMAAASRPPGRPRSAWTRPGVLHMLTPAMAADHSLVATSVQFGSSVPITRAKVQTSRCRLIAVGLPSMMAPSRSRTTSVNSPVKRTESSASRL